MMKNNQRGSTIIMVLCVMTAVLLLAGVALRNSVYGLDIALKRLEHEQQFRAVDGLMRYAIAAVKENYDLLSKQSDTVVWNIGQWPTMYHNSPYRGMITIRCSDGIAVAVSLERSKNTVCGLSCVVLQGQDEDSHNFYIKNWRLDDTIQTQKDSR